MSERVKIDFNDINGEDIHIMRNVGSDISYVWFEDGHSAKVPENIFVPLCANDFNDLIIKDNDGNYIVRGLTLVSPNGSYMSILRNNDFSEDDEKNYVSTYSSLLDDLQNYFSIEEAYYMKATLALGETGMDKAYSFKRKNMRQDYGYGTIHEYLKEQDYEQEFKECNVRLIIKKNK